MDYMVKFVGKVNLIERIYEVPIKKLLFSTGSRAHIWRGLERYPNLKDIEIFDVFDFRDCYQNLYKRVKLG